MADASGMSRNTVIKAEREVTTGISPSDRQRAVGGGDIKAEVKQPGLLEALDELVHPETRGNPMSFLRWTSKSTTKLADDLVRQGFKITDDTVGRILKSLGYSLQAPAKEKEGTAHPDRDAQFRYLNARVGAFMKAGEPVISVDTKKKELVGEFSNGGREYHLIGEPTRTKTHDFVDKELGRAVPYGVYDLANDEGWVSVGATTVSTAAIAARKRALAEWEAANVGVAYDPELFVREILPGLATVKLSEIIAATGMSKASASDVRRGKRTPHLSTWGALAELAGVRS